MIDHGGVTFISARCLLLGMAVVGYVLEWNATLFVARDLFSLHLCLWLPSTNYWVNCSVLENGSIAGLPPAAIVFRVEHRKKNCPDMSAVLVWYFTFAAAGLLWLFFSICGSEMGSDFRGTR